MLHYYRFKNFFSFEEETEVSFVLGKQPPITDFDCYAKSGTRLSKFLAVIGPNGSGKTNILKPLAFLRWFISDSFLTIKPDEENHIETHFFSEKEDSEFEVVFEIAGNIFKYELSINKKRVTSEALYLKTSHLFSYLFRREWDANTGSYRIVQNKFGLASKESSKVRSNASLISTAAQYNVDCARKITDFFDRIYPNVTFSGKRNFDQTELFRATEYYSEHPETRKQMSAILSKLDFGISEVEIQEVKFKNEEGEIKSVNLPFGVHKKGDKTVNLEMRRESSGTQRAFVLLRSMLPALESGGIVIIDEMEADLHPDVLLTLIELFASEDANPNNAQLIFTCHAHEVLNVLDKSQVLLVEKSEYGSSEAWRLDKMKGVRRDDNLYAKYRAGAYGAIPNI